MSRVATGLPYTELEVADGNFDTSRKPIDRVIIHTMVGTWQAAAARFDNPTQKVSAHYGVKKDGGIIHWLEETFTAYHAGDYAMNQRSIGIEHEDEGDFNGVRPDTLYASSAKLVRDICLFYNIPIDRQHILKHSEVIATGCPDALDIDRIVREAQGQDQQSVIEELRTARDKNWNLYETEVSVNNDLKKQIQTEQQKNQDLRNANDSLTKADADTGAQLIDAQHAVNDFISALGLPAGTSNQVALDKITGLLKPHEEVVKQVQPTLDALANAAIMKRAPKKTKSLLEKLRSFFPF
jgi:N-acetyl-anhydromuramyl-L-alanine amidase AmpD